MGRPAIRALARARDEEPIEAALRAVRAAGWGTSDLAVVGPGGPLRLADEADDVRWIRATPDAADQRNAALRSVPAGTEWLIVLDVDLGLVPGAIETLIRAAEDRPDVAIVAGRVVDRRGDVLEAGRDFLHPFGLEPRFASIAGPVARLVDGGLADDEPRVVDSVSTRFALIRIEAVAPLAWWGGAAADFPTDDDLALRLAAADWNVVDVPGAVVRDGGADVSRAWHLSEAARREMEARHGFDPVAPDLERIEILHGATGLAARLNASIEERDAAVDELDVLMVVRDDGTRLGARLDREFNRLTARGRLLIFDNASSDATSDVLRVARKQLGEKLHVVRSPVRVSEPVALDWLFAESSAPVLMRLELDAELPEGAIDRLVEALRLAPRAAVAGATVREHDGGGIVRVPHVEPGAVLYRRSLLERTRGFDVGFAPTGGADRDLHHRAWRARRDVVEVRDVLVTRDETPTSDDEPGLEAAHRARLEARWGQRAAAVLDEALNVGFWRVDETTSDEPTADALSAIVVVASPDAAGIRRTVESLLARTPPGTELIVVDDAAGGDATAWLTTLADRPDVTVRTEDARRPVARCRADAASAAAGDVLLFVEAGTVVAEGTVAALLREHADRGGVIAPLLLGADGRVLEAGLGVLPNRLPAPLARGWRARDERIAALGEVQAIGGHCFVVGRELWKSAGDGGSETELGTLAAAEFCFRVAAVGGTIRLLPGAYAFSMQSSGVPPATPDDDAVAAYFQRLDGAERAVEPDVVRLSVIPSAGGGRVLPEDEPTPLELTSIVIPMFNKLDLTIACVDSIEAATPERHEIIIVDNGSGEPAAPQFAGRPNLRVVRSPENLGFAGGANLGILASRGRWVVIQNNDTEVAPGWLRRLRAHLDEGPRVGAVVPSAVFVGGRQQMDVEPYADHLAFRRRAEQVAHDHDGRCEDADRVTGLSMLMRRDVLREIGLFDTRYRIGNFEDNDLCFRLRRRGYRLLIARDVLIHHVGSQTFSAISEDYRDLLIENGRRHGVKWKDDPYFKSLTTRDPDEREELLRTALTRTPELVDVHNSLGALLLELGRPDEARGYLQRYLEQCPRDPVALLRMAAIARALGDHEETMTLTGALLNEYLLRPTERVSAHVLRGRSRLAFGALQGAQDDFAAAAEIDPDVHNDLGVVLHTMGRAEEAATAFESALRQDPRDRASFDNLFDLSSMLDRPEMALRALEPLLSVDPENEGLADEVDFWRSKIVERALEESGIDANL